jgi:hypothetical protein
VTNLIDFSPPCTIPVIDFLEAVPRQKLIQRLVRKKGVVGGIHPFFGRLRSVVLIGRNRSEDDSWNGLFELFQILAD